MRSSNRAGGYPLRPPKGEPEPGGPAAAPEVLKGDRERRSGRRYSSRSPRLRERLRGEYERRVRRGGLREERRRGERDLSRWMWSDMNKRQIRKAVAKAVQCYDFDEMKMGRSKRRVQRTAATVEGATPRGVGVLGVGQVTISLRGAFVSNALRTSGVEAWGHWQTLFAHTSAINFFGIKHCDGKVFPLSPPSGPQISRSGRYLIERRFPPPH